MQPPASDDADPQHIARLERALAGSHDGFWERNLRTQRSWYSPSFRAMFGFGDELPDDRHVVNGRIHPDDVAGYLAAHEEAIRELKPFSYEVRFRDALGRWRWVRGRGRVWAGADGHAEIVAGALSDITEAKEAALALARAEAQRAEAERANETKSLFLAHMSHEMRTPLNGVLGLTDLALRAAQSPVQQRYLELSLQSGRALLQIIDDALDFSRVAAGKLVLHDEPFDLADLLAEAIRGVAPQLRAQALGWRFDYEGDITSVRGDRPRLRQIITNLLGNAAKFTDRGHVAVRVQTEPLDAQRVRTRVHVIDTGPGLDADAQARVFDAFVQADASLARRHGGTGLGLSIARSLAQAMGGALTLQSSPGEGAHFTLELALPLGPQTPIPAAEAGAPRAMWLVYRQRDLAEWMARRFARLNWRACVLPDLDAACVEARRVGPHEQPALVVVAEHVLAPGCDLAGLRAALPGAGIALVIRPDWNQPQLEQRALQLGMRLSIAPLTPRDLRDITTLARGPSAAAAGGTSGRAAEPGRLPPSERAPRVLLVEDNDVNRLIATELLQALGARVVAVAGGEAALAACEEEPPELVLMDLQMPGMDGLETCRRLREMQRQGRLPAFRVIALTAHAMADDRAASLAAGMDGFLTKPIVFDAMRRELARWLPAFAPA